MAVNSNSKLREILADEKAVELLKELSGGLFSGESAEMGPVMGMKFKTLMNFPQTGLSKEEVDKICNALDNLYAE